MSIRASVIRDLTQDLHYLQSNARKLRRLDSRFIRYAHEFDILEQSAIALLEGAHDNVERLNVAVIGMFSSGKSSFINWVLGDEVCPIDVAPTTSAITQFVYGPKVRIREMDLNEQGTGYRDITFETYKKRVKHHAGDADRNQQYRFRIEYPFAGFQNIILHDTPGFGNTKNPHDTNVTIGTIKHADVFFIVTDANQPELTQALSAQLQELKIGARGNRRCFLVLTRADQVPVSQAKRAALRILESHPGVFHQYFLVNAKTAVDPWKRIRSEIYHAAEKFIKETSTGTEKQVTIRSEVNHGVIAIQINGERFEVGRKTPEGVATPQELEQLFSNLVKKKGATKNRAMDAEYHRYRERLPKLLADLLKELSAFIQARSNRHDRIDILSMNARSILADTEKYISQLK